MRLKEVFLIFSWALYDLANQFFAVNVVSLYFVRWLTLEKAVPEIFYSIAFGLSTLLVAICAPLLGWVSDITRRYKPFLTFFTLLSVFFTILIGQYDSVILGLLFFAIANFGCQLAIVFYNALMLNVTPKSRIGLVSGLGRMFGYSGAILALYLIKPVVIRSGYQAAFFPSGILFLIFSLPCLLFIKDVPKAQEQSISKFLNKERAQGALKQLRQDIADCYKIAHVPDYFKGSFLGLCVVNVIILFMSVYASQVFKLDESQIINLIGFSTIFAILGSIASGYISDYLGIIDMLAFTITSWMIIVSLGSCAADTNLYWFIGAMTGFALGSTWVILRALAIRLVPVEKIGSVFGLFNLVGCLSGITGTLFWGLILLGLSSLKELGYRMALFSLNLFLAFSLIYFLRLRNSLDEDAKNNL